MNDIKDFVPYAIGIATTVIALKKDWIMSKFTKTEKELEVAASAEGVDSHKLDNVEKEIDIYRGIVDDLKSTVDDLKQEISELKALVEEQKVFIAKQSKSLHYYEKKYGQMTHPEETQTK